jgi:peptidoglycan/LPS O-acetylase OafA/YrhL
VRVAAPSTHDRNAGLDGMRALAALSVLVFHVWLYRENRPHSRRTELLDQVMFELNTGLLCFFVLSGFLLYGAFSRAALGGPSVALADYFRRRIARIVPAYWVCGAVVLLLYWAVGPHNITPSPAQVPVYAFFLQNYSMSTIGRLNPVAWTLCVEVAFYVVLPLIGWAAVRLGRKAEGQVALLLAIVVGSIAWNVAVWDNHWSPLTRQALPAYMGTFAVGMLVAVWAQSRRAAGKGRIGPRATLALVLGGAAGVVGNAWWHEGTTGGGPARIMFGLLLCAAGFALVVAAVAVGRGRAIAWLSWRPLVAVGVVSYGLYLWHLPLLLVLRTAGLLPHDLLPRIVVVLVPSLLVAAVSWHWVEKPWIAWAHRRRPVRAPADAAAEPA